MAEITFNDEEVYTLEVQKAQAKFTDRIMPQRAFWESYQYLLAHPNEFKMLYYYGFGGIGKTALCNELIQSLSRSVENNLLEEPLTKYAYFSFDVTQDPASVFRFIATDLKLRYQFDFTTLFYNLYYYALRTGNEAQRPDPETIISSVPYLENAIDFIGLIPVIGSAGIATIKLLDKYQANRKMFSEQLRAEIEVLSKMDVHDIKSRIAISFAKDLRRNLAKETKPFVMVFDTYEKFTNIIRSSESNYLNEEWLWHKVKGVIRQIPNMLWVFAGQNELQSRWVKHDTFWKDETALEQHRIDRLEDSDVVDYLASVEVTDPDIVRMITERSKGVPITIDICVNIYKYKCAFEEPLTENDLKGDQSELVKRIIGYLSNVDKDTIRLLACFQSWYEHELSNPELNLVSDSYERVKGLAFIVIDKGYGFVHDSVIKDIRDDCNRIIKYRYHQFLLNQLSKKDVAAERLAHYQFHKIVLDFELLTGSSSEVIEQQVVSLTSNHIEMLENYIKNQELTKLGNILSVIFDSFERLNLSDGTKLPYQLIYATYLSTIGENDSAIRLAEKLSKQVDTRKIDSMYSSFAKAMQKIHYDLELYEESLNFAIMFYRCEHQDASDRLLSVFRLCQCFYKLDHIEKATKYCELGIDMLLNIESKTLEDISYLFKFYIQKARILRMSNYDEEALKIIKLAIELAQNHDLEHYSFDAQFDLTASYQVMGDISNSLRDVKSAGEAYQRAYSDIKTYCESNHTSRMMRNLVIGTQRLANYYTSQSLLDLAKVLLDELSAHRDYINDMQPDAKALDVAEMVHKAWANYYKANRNFDLAKGEYEKLVCLLEANQRKLPRDQYVRSRLRLHILIAEMCKLQKDSSAQGKEMECIINQLMEFDTLAGTQLNMNVRISCYRALASYYLSMNNTQKALKYEQLVLNYNKRLYTHSKSYYYGEGLNNSLIRLSEISRKQNNVEAELEYLKEALVVSEWMAEQFPQYHTSWSKLIDKSQIALCYYRRKAYQEALAWIEGASDAAKKLRLDYPDKAIQSYGLIFRFRLHHLKILKQLKDYAKLYELAQESINLFETIDKSHLQPNDAIYYQVSQLLAFLVMELIYRKQDYTSALKYIEQMRLMGFNERDNEFIFFKASSYLDAHLKEPCPPSTEGYLS